MIMEQITNYVKPELIVVAIALYFVGMALKQAQAVKDKYPSLSPAFDYGNYIIQLYPLHSWYRRSIVLSRIVRYDDCSW